MVSFMAIVSDTITRVRQEIFVTSCLLALLFVCTTAKAQAAMPACVKAKDINLAELKVERCTTLWPESENNTIDDLQNYYGQILLRSSTSTSVEAEKKLAKAVAAFFNIKKEFTAVVNLSVYMQQGGKDILVFQAPIYKLSQSNSGKMTVSSYELATNGSEISPYFALNNGNTAVRVKMNLSLVKGQTTEVLRTINAAAQLSKTGWLFTTLSEPAAMAFASKIQSTVDAVYSSVATSDTQTELTFDSKGYKAAKFTASLVGSSSSNGAMSVEVYLNMIPSLITKKTRQDGSFLRPDVTGVSGIRWASRIFVDSELNTIETILTKKGVPRLLEDLRVASGEPAVSKKELVESACNDLRSALGTSTFRLNENDIDLILFDELQRAGVFIKYKPAELRCTEGMEKRWFDRYGLEVPTVVARDMPWPDKERRLKRVWTSWGFADAEARARGLAEDIVSPNVDMAAPEGFFPGLTVNPSEDGLQHFPASGMTLATHKQTCFGNYKKTSVSEQFATAFARFEAMQDLYLIVLTFDGSEDWSPGFGPLVKRITIQPATPALIEQYRNPSTDSCI